MKYKENLVEKTIQDLVSDAIDFSKLQVRINKRTKVMSPHIMKDPARYEYKNSFTGIHDDEVSCIEKLSNGNLISGSLDSTVRIWDANTGQLFRVFEGHTHEVSQILELRNGNIASASHDNTINVWDRQTSLIIYTLEGFEDRIKLIAELDADNIVILNENDSSFTVWNFKQDQHNNCKYFDDHKATINQLIVIQNKFIFTASDDKTVRRWRLKGTNAEITFSGHDGPVYDIAYLDEALLASASAD